MLARRTVIVTRAAGQSGALCARLRALGAVVVEMPLTATIDPSDGGAALETAIAAIGRYEWVVLASRNAARRFSACRPPLGGVMVAAVGPGTATELQKVDLVPVRNDAEGLVAAFPSGNGRVLIPQAAQGRPALAAGLRAKGWTVDVVEAYTTVPIADPFGALSDDDREAVAAADTVILAAPSAVRAWVAAVADAPGPPIAPSVVCMGPATAAEAAAGGLAAAATADPSTLDGLVAAVVRAGRRSG